MPGSAAGGSARTSIADGRVTVDGVSGARVGGSTRRSRRIAVDGVPVAGRARPRPLPAQQAGRRRHDRVGPAGSTDGRLARPRPSPRVFPVGRLDRDDRGAARPHQRRRARPAAGASRRTGSRRSTWRRCDGVPRAGALRRLREGVELDDGHDRARRGRRGRRRACSGSSSTRAGTARSDGCARRSATRCVGWCGPASGRLRTARCAPGAVAGADVGRGPGALDGRGRPASRGKAQADRQVDARPPAVRALRGATTVDDDTAEQITERVQELLRRADGPQRPRRGRHHQHHLHRDGRRRLACSRRPRPGASGFGAVPLLCAGGDRGRPARCPAASGRCST